MEDVKNWLLRLPYLTRHWFIAAIVLPLLLWRPVTAAIYFPVGFLWLMKLYLLVSYSRKLEEEHYATKQGTYAFLLVILLGPMINSVVYIWCQLNPNVIIRFWFGTEFKAKIFPLVLAIMDLILYNDWIAQAIGILAGHAYYFSTTEWARLHGRPLFETPRQSLFRNPRMAQMSEGIYVEDYRDTGPTRLTPSTYSFPGTGRVLSDTAQ
ncbi:Derlin-1 [Folsomia candida]|uniref:Derlin n=1 Tax=Folsomia candida TaxID=158441 RepID=A0A226DNP2_FOLCA|nr:Derlin-1 [Folsomia candida]